MNLEYLLVNYKENCGVYANDVLVGATNHILMLQPGGYEIRLDGAGAALPTQTIDLDGTTIVRPMVVTFS